MEPIQPVLRNRALFFAKQTVAWDIYGGGEPKKDQKKLAPIRIVHARIKNGKLWIEEDWTEEGITDDLLRAGVKHEKIVLGLPPPTRPL